ncbi:MAG: DUF4388 domain-containing protein, partial [Myxococcota bacterium]
IDGLELARRIGLMPRPVPVLLVSSYGRGDLLARARAQGIAVAGFLPKPVDPDRLGRVLDGLLSPGAAADAADDWSGSEFLARVAGPVERFPPARVLFLAHRIEATGAVRVRHADSQALVGLRAGRIVHVAGVPGLLRSLDPRIPETGELASAIGAAVLAGHAADRALQAAAESLGEYLARLIGSRGGEVRFDPAWTPPQGSFPLPEPIPRVIAAGLRRARAPAQVERTWDALDMATVRARIPDDSPEARWGLDATAMRVLRIAPRARDLGDLVESTTGGDAGRRPDVLRAVEVLYLLGMLVVDGGPLDPVNEGTRTPAKVESTREDPRLVRLREALAAMENAHPVDVLEVGDKRALAEADVANAYREVSRRFHPDLFFNAPPVVRGLAEACFAKVNAAYEQLRLPGGLVEAQRMLEARANGVQFVSDRDHVSARIAFRRGEILWRNRDWKGADAQFAEAFKLDPYTWPHALYHAHCGWLAKRIPAAEALKQLDALKPKEPQRQAEILVVTGQVLKMENRLDEAVARYRQAIEKDPANHEAQRELRLHERRNPPPPASPPPTAGGFFSGLLKGKKPS